jgi:hypothetical protein
VEENFNGSELSGGILKCIMEASTSLKHGCIKLISVINIVLKCKQETIRNKKNMGRILAMAEVQHKINIT